MQWNASDLWIALLALALLAAAVGDWRRRIIPNWLNGAIALGAVGYWIAAGLSVWPDIAAQAATALVVFILFALAFRIGAMGGGDVKLVTAIALWLPPIATVKLLVVMSIAGGVLTAAMLIRQRVAKAEGRIEVPYGMAIAFAGFWLIGERYLNQFG